MAPDRLTYPRSSRLTSRKELQQVLRNGKRVQSELLELRGLASHLHAKVGVIVPRHRQSAVERNRLKRRLREITRVSILPDLRDVVIVIRTYPAAYTVTVTELRADILRLVPQLIMKLC